MKIRYSLVFLSFLILNLGMVKAMAASSGLIEKAKAEGEFSFYTSMNIGESKPLLDAFQKKYPFIETKLTRIGGTAFATRIITEARAGHHLWDVAGPTMLYGSEIIKRGMVAPLSVGRKEILPAQIQGQKEPLDVYGSQHVCHGL